MTAGSAEDTDFRPERPAKADASPTVQAEAQQFAAAATPNTVLLSFGRLGHISWHSESSTAVLGLIVLLLLCVLTLLITLSALAPYHRSGSWQRHRGRGRSDRGRECERKWKPAETRIEWACSRHVTRLSRRLTSCVNAASRAQTP